MHDSHFFWLTNLPDFCSIFLIFQYFFSVLFKELNKYNSINNQRIKKNWPKLPHFSSILSRIPRLFQSAQYSPTFLWLENALIFSQSMWESWYGNNIMFIFYITNLILTMRTSLSRYSWSCWQFEINPSNCICYSLTSSLVLSANIKAHFIILETETILQILWVKSVMITDKNYTEFIFNVRLHFYYCTLILGNQKGN